MCTGTSTRSRAGDWLTAPRQSVLEVVEHCSFLCTSELENVARDCFKALEGATHTARLALALAYMVMVRDCECWALPCSATSWSWPQHLQVTLHTRNSGHYAKGWWPMATSS